eukprot:3513511-Pyramimonas_sp.AAC.1
MLTLTLNLTFTFPELLTGAPNWTWQALDMKPTLPSLREANLSHNVITKLPDLSDYKHLVNLNLEGNQISSCESIAGATALKVCNTTFP